MDWQLENAASHPGHFQDALEQGTNPSHCWLGDGARVLAPSLISTACLCVMWVEKRISQFGIIIVYKIKKCVGCILCKMSSPFTKCIMLPFAAFGSIIWNVVYHHVKDRYRRSKCVKERYCRSFLLLSDSTTSTAPVDSQYKLYN